MKIAVLGCGAIGGLFLGYLSKEGQDVQAIVRDYQKGPLVKEGLIIEGSRGFHKLEVKVDTELKEKVDLAIFATKINDLKEIIEKNSQYLKEAYVVSTQNGVKADHILAEYFEKERIITSVVMFGATFYAPNKIVHNFEGELVLGNIFYEKLEGFNKAEEVLSYCFPVRKIKNIKGAKYLKLFINLNNCIPAVLGLSMQEAFSDFDCAKLAIQLNREAYEVIEKSGIILESLPSYPKERIESLVTMPINEAAGLFSKIIVSLSKEPLYGSILQSIKRGRSSEIDYINGEITRIASENKLKAPLNSKIVDLVHQVEESKSFLSKEELLTKMEA